MKGKTFWYLQRKKTRAPLTILGHVMLALIAIVVILFCMFLIMRSASGEDSQRMLTEAKKAEIRRLIKYHGLQGIAVVEVHNDDSLWFERDGELLRFK